MSTTRTKPAVGDIKRMSYQSDVTEPRYELVRHLGGGIWRCRMLEADDRTLDRIAALEGSTYFDADKELARSIEMTGELFDVRLVSAARFAAAF